MLIRSLACEAVGGRRVLSATVVWEDQGFPSQQLVFEIGDSTHSASVAPGLERIRGSSSDDAGADAFLAACFPLAAVHGETRVRIEGWPCPMLVEGLRTVHAWWSSWGGMTHPAPDIETARPGRAPASDRAHRAMALLSGGVDSLHMLLRNHRLYSPDDPAHIREALFIHGFDIGKRARDPEDQRYRAALQRLAAVAAETGVSLLTCRTNLRHLPSKPGFWMYRHSGAALAAAGHAALCGPGFLFIGGTYHVSHPVPFGSHPAVDGLFSTQRTRVMHDGSRFTRLEKVRDLASWPTALAALRVCPGGAKDGVNCGRCEKCLRTRLELLAAGVSETEAFGRSLASVELWQEAVPMPIAETALHHEELVPALRKRGYHDLCRVIEEGIALYRRGCPAESNPPASGISDRPANPLEWH
jgi:hypothetical protein